MSHRHPKAKKKERAEGAMERTEEQPVVCNSCVVRAGFEELDCWEIGLFGECECSLCGKTFNTSSEEAHTPVPGDWKRLQAAYQNAQKDQN